jgi:alkylated DNA repair dioxygenase AlkB
MDKYLIKNKKRTISHIEEDTTTDVNNTSSSTPPPTKKQRTKTFKQIINNNEAQVSYMASFLSSTSATELYNAVKKSVNWQQPTFELYPGKQVSPPRRMATMGDEGIRDLYRPERIVTPWINELKIVRDKIQQVTGQDYNFAVLNYYRDGKDYIGAHSDNEKESIPGSIIASLSLGSERDFILHHKQTKAKTTVVLEHGSLLLMGGHCQQYYKHSVPKRLKATQGRINITFRNIRVLKQKSEV